MKHQLYVIMQPGADRPYISHTPPTEFQKKPGAKVFDFVLDIPGFDVDASLGTIEVTPPGTIRIDGGPPVCDWCRQPPKICAERKKPHGA
jgi:hypothetical protein